MDDTAPDISPDEGPPDRPPGSPPPGGAPGGGTGVRTPAFAPQRPTAASLLTWGTVALVLVIVVVLVVVKLTGSSPTSTAGNVAPTQAAPAAVVTAVTTIPASVFDAVGATSAAAPLIPPRVLHGQPPLRYDGKPGVLFVGNEFCPYCAAERWALVAALSRFGTFRGLDSMSSGSNEVFSGTPTFTFVDTRYSSRYVGVRLVEHYGEQRNSAGTAYSVLTPLSAADRALLRAYGDPTSAGSGPLVPFLDIANQAVSAGGLFSPAVFQQLSVTKIAAGLTDPKDPATQAIVGAANDISAAVCAADGARPAAVCTSRAVMAAATAMAPG